MKYRRHCTFILVVLCLIVCITLPANANSVPVMGSAHVGWPYPTINLGSSSFGVWSVFPGEGPETIAWGTVGVPVVIGGYAGVYGGVGTAEGGIFNLWTHWIDGGITVTSAPFTITDAIAFAGTFTVPVTVEGSFWAYRDVWDTEWSSTAGDLLGTFTFTGTGIATYRLWPYRGNNQFWVSGGDVTFAGTGTAIAETPEPASLLLLSTGFAGMAMMMRRGRNLFRISGRS